MHLRDHRLCEIPDSKTPFDDMARPLARTAGDKSMSAYALAGLGSVELKSADFTAARNDLEEALSLRKELGEKDTITGTSVLIAALDIEEGHPAAAEKPAREARDDFEKAHKRDDQVTAAAVLVDALVTEGKNDDALKEVSKATPIAAKSQNLSVHLIFALASARADAASQKIVAAKTILKEALAKATRSSYLGDQLEARLVLEEIEMKSGKSAASRARLEQLQKDAKEKGFNVIANKAAAL